MEAADGLSADVSTANTEWTEAKKAGNRDRAAIIEERTALEAEVDRLRREKTAAAAEVDKVVLAKYQKLLEQRKMVAVSAIKGELCTTCHVRLRPAVIQIVRRHAEIVYCDSCQRILYAPPALPAEPVAPA